MTSETLRIFEVELEWKYTLHLLQPKLESDDTAYA